MNAPVYALSAETIEAFQRLAALAENTRKRIAACLAVEVPKGRALIGLRAEIEAWDGSDAP